MYKKGKVYVPKDDKLRTEIIRLHYDTPVGEHEDSGKQWNWSLETFGGQELQKK